MQPKKTKTLPYIHVLLFSREKKNMFYYKNNLNLYIYIYIYYGNLNLYFT